MSKQHRGTSFPVDAHWKRLVTEHLERVGMHQAELAAKVGATPGAISQLLKGASKASKFAHRIASVTGIPLPVDPDPESPEFTEYLRLARQIRQYDPAFFAAELPVLKRVLQRYQSSSGDLGDPDSQPLGRSPDNRPDSDRNAHDARAAEGHAPKRRRRRGGGK